VPAQKVADHPRVKQSLQLAAVWLDAMRAYNQVPGLSAAIVHDQDVIWSGALGVSDLERKTPATTSTIYSICSISKLFTSVALMQLRDQGKVRLDDPVSKHLAWFTALKRQKPEAGEITVEGLLTHASGLPRESNHPYWSAPDFPFPTREQIIEGLKSQEALYPAETYWQYSNLGITLAGEIVSAASGMPYGDYVRRHILEPLGLSRTSPEMPEAERGRSLATGYSSLDRDGKRSPTPFFQARGIAPAAGYASTVEDLAKFASWQFRVLSGKSQDILRQATLREMQRVHWVDPDFETTWGLGFAVWRNSNRTFVGHGGSCPGYRSQLLLRPEEKIATVVAANAMINTSLYAQELYDIVAPALNQAAKGTAAKPADSTLSAYTGTYSAQPWGSETAIVAWEDGLAMVGLPNNDPVGSLTKLRKTGEHTFRRIRRDDELAETVTFEMGPDGKAVRYVQHGNRYPRLR
jgi:CubicO group peptidase (beta-lactamase class C family)